ncbi:hypothetical protein C0583_05475 [Candidatus Parcubacteria bacterium]|nr:MAG: hypothetical protein C0583_05475 [Candidatus Parcubacteria bacterium]
MSLYEKIYEKFEEKAKKMNIKYICVGIGYSGVILEDGSAGIAYTFFTGKPGCSLVDGIMDMEGKPAVELLKHIKNENSVMRSIAAACVNALNHDNTKKMSNDDNTLFDKLGVNENTTVSMVGYFGPIIKMLEKKGVKEIDIIDNDREIGEKGSFNNGLESEPDIAILTSTSLLNGTFPELSSHIKKGTKTILMGPSTIMIPEIFKDFGINYLAGTSVVDTENMFKYLRLGGGTPILKNYGDKKLIDTGR